MKGKLDIVGAVAAGLRRLTTQRKFSYGVRGLVTALVLVKILSAVNQSNLTFA
jgi:hypothetical protein